MKEFMPSLLPREQFYQLLDLHHGGLWPSMMIRSEPKLKRNPGADWIHGADPKMYNFANVCTIWPWLKSALNNAIHIKIQ